MCNENTGKEKLYLPRIFGLADLLGGSKQDDSEAGFPEGSSILIGGPSGADKTIFALSLMRQWLIKDFFEANANPQTQPANSSTSPMVRKARLSAHQQECAERNREWLCYVSTSGDKSSLIKRFSRHGWFSDVDPVFGRRAEVVDVAETHLPQPTRGAAELINPVFTFIDQRACLHEASRVFVIVDSLTTLLKDSTGEGDRRRNAQELITRFRMTFKDRLGLLILVAEYPPGQAAGFSAEEHVADVVFRLQTKTIGLGRRRRTLEAVKARGINMTLGMHSWEIVSHRKSRHALASRGLLNHVMRLAGAEPKAKRPLAGAEPKAKMPWCTIVIFPRPRLFPIEYIQGWRRLRNEPKSPGSAIFSGVPGLDEMLRGDSDYWARSKERTSAGSDLAREMGSRLPGLRPGSATLILGKSGTGKTLASLQFLLAQAHDVYAEEACATQDSSSEERIKKLLKKTLYINFENRPSRIRDVFPGGPQKRLLRYCRALYHRHADLDMNCLLAEIRYVVNKHLIERIAIDGLSDLFAELDRQEWSMLIEDLLVSLRQDRLALYKRHRRASALTEELAGADAKSDHEQPSPPPLPTLLMTLETDAGLDALPTLGALSFAADNLLVFEHVLVNDVVRNTLRVVKARGCAPDRQTREAVVHAGKGYPFRIVPGLENYRGLRSSRPTPVQIALQLVAENVNEERFNQDLCGRLKRLFAYPVRAFGFSRSELMRTLRDISAGVTRIPQADVKVLSIDEWWIRELDPRHGPFAATSAKHPLLPLETYVTPSSKARPDSREPEEPVPSDYWIPELEKACVLLPTAGDAEALPSAYAAARPSRDPRGARRIDVVAYPCYIDFGLFCLNPAVLSGRTTARESERGWLSWLAEIPRAWAELDRRAWFVSPRRRKPYRTVVDFIKATLARSSGQCIGYAFDMETSSTVASAALELCWTFGATEDFLMRDAPKYCDLSQEDRDTWIRLHPLTLALQLLEFLVVEKLMPARTSLRDTARAVLCRHWYSTLFHVEHFAPDEHGVKARRRARKRQVQRASALPLPFFPVGQFRVDEEIPAGPLLVALQDSLFRFRRLVARVRAAVAHRHPGEYSEMRCKLDNWYREADDASKDIESRVSQRSGSRRTSGMKKYVALIREASKEIREFALKSKVFQVGCGARATDGTPERTDQLWAELPAAISMDLRDVLQLLDWCDFRTELVQAELERETLASVIAGRANLRDGASRSVRSTSKGTEVPLAVTGYSCAGSWMIGVDRGTHSPALAKRLIDEITSLRMAGERAARGAGIPARKDFYEFHGHEPVPVLEGLCREAKPVTWEEFLTYTVSRTYTRDRTICSQLSTSKLLEELSQKVLHCMTRASHMIASYEDESKRDETIEKLQEFARTAAAEVLEIADSEMRKLRNSRQEAEAGLVPDADQCSLCVNFDSCQYRNR